MGYKDAELSTSAGGLFELSLNARRGGNTAYGIWHMKSGLLLSYGILWHMAYGVRSFIITFDVYFILNIFDKYDNKRPDPICVTPYALCDPICAP